MSPAGAGLAVVADLTVRLEAPDGRRTTLVVRDEDGVLRVEVGDVGVLLACLPRGSGGAARDVRAALARARGRSPVVVWDQPVDVLVAGRVVLRRRSGRWRAPAGLVVPVASAAAAVLVVSVGVVLGLVAGLRRAVRALGAGGR